MQPCLLIMLKEGDAHGYDMLNRIHEFGFAPGAMDVSIGYRALRDMEEIGWVSSTWDDESLGPQRRVYRLTRDGETALETWVEDLKKTRGEIDALLAAYERHSKK